MLTSQRVLRVQPRPAVAFLFRTTLVLAGLTFWLDAVWLDAVQACETPVYRYAMYRWQPTPYEVYFLHRGNPAPEHDRVRLHIEEVSENTENRANLVYLPVNVEEDPDLLSVPPDVKQAWQKAESELPGYLVSTPYGAELFTGTLDEESVRALAESPARKSLSTQLESGKVGVFVLLSGSDKGANEGARAILEDVVQDVAAGDISLYVPPTGQVDADDAESEKPRYELGIIEIDRESKEEAWFVKSLLAIEPDLKEEQRPMVYLVYGRARALLPYIGKGISRENLLREVEFISGACSCTVKEQNPGVDLLVRHDWEAAAAAIAERVGSEEGNESMDSDMFFPELIIPSTTVAAAPEAVKEAVDNTESSAEERAQDGEDDRKVTASSESIAAATTQVGGDLDEAKASRTDDTTEVASLPQPAEAATGESLKVNTDFSVFAIVGGGLVVSLIVLFGVTLLVLRPQ